MRIIALVIKNSGVSYHRLIVPLILMENVDVYITNNLDEKDFENGCDIFMYNRTYADSAVPKIKALQQRYGFKVVCDVDDYWHLDPHHVLYEDYLQQNFADRQRDHLRAADAVTTTHERLAELIMPYNTNVHIMPNAIPSITTEEIVRVEALGSYTTLLSYVRQYEWLERTPSEFVRLFWQGSDTHRADIDILRTAIERLGDLSKSIKMVMSGYAEENAEWEQMVRAYTANLKHQYKLIPYKPVTEYYEAYREADVCLVPLVNSPFNKMKSNLKVLEAANAGLPCIVSNVHPYKDMPVLYSRRPTDWVENIKRLVKNPAMRQDMGAKLQEWCLVNFNFYKINQERRQLLEYTAKGISV